LRTPFGLGKHIHLEYIEVEVALGLSLMDVNMRGLVGWMSKMKCWRMGPKRPRGSIAKGNRIMFWSRMSLVTVSPMVVTTVVGIFFCVRASSFCKSVDVIRHWPLKF
jgi:hypothetical protein